MAVDTFTSTGIINNPTVQYIQNDTSQVEPLDGPVAIDALMDRFPDTVYTAGRDTHLYKFISGMCGDVGAGLLKKQAYIVRLMDEGQLLTFTDLDTFYVQTLRFPRLSNELYTGDPNLDVLTKEQWDELTQKDEHYRQRVMQFFQGTRLGNSPDGMKLIAESGAGVPVDLIENYQAIFDALTDDPLGLEIQGLSKSPSEFVLIPRVTDASGNVDTDVAYTATFSKEYVTATGNEDFVMGSTPLLNPNIERNMVNVLDRLRPVGALMTVKSREVIYSPVAISDVDASSERAYVSRFVTGSPSVSWPDTDSNGFFIVSGVEAEAPFFALSGRELPTIFHTIENENAYTESALDDPTYNTSDFYLVTNGVSPFLKYKSEHAGQFHKVISSIYPFLKNASPDGNFTAADAIASQNTQLVVEGRSKP